MADTLAEVNCPACGRKMMKFYMDNARVYVDICLDGCGGIFFDNRELEKFDTQNYDEDEILSQVERGLYVPVDESLVRVCPVCKSNMTKIGAAGGRIEIDVCNTCGSKFLDHGELMQIRQFKSDSVKIDKFIDEMVDVIYGSIKRPAKTSYGRTFIEKLVRKCLY